MATLALTWIAVIPGLTAKSVDGASAFSYPLIFLPFISSAFVPTDTMPGPVRFFAERQPVTSIVNTIRDLLTQRPVGTDIWTALAWCVGILIVAYMFANRMSTTHVGRGSSAHVPRPRGRRRGGTASIARAGQRHPHHQRSTGDLRSPNPNLAPLEGHRWTLT
jgi:hypothetical protein